VSEIIYVDLRGVTTSDASICLFNGLNIATVAVGAILAMNCEHSLIDPAR
jgi:hypothetical protein